MNKVLSSSVIFRGIEDVVQMIAIATSPKIASEVSKYYWTKLFEDSNKNASLETYEFFYAHIKKIMNPNKTDSILDAGCGGGELTYLFYKDGFKIKGFDSSKSAIIKAKKRFGTDLFYLDDLINLKTVEKFSKIFLNSVFLCIHPAYYEVVLKNLFRITKDEGVVYLFDNPDFSKRHVFYGQFRTRTKILNVVTFFFPIYKKYFGGFWVKTQKVKKAALKAGFSEIETVNSWSNYRTHHILYK